MKEKTTLKYLDTDVTFSEVPDEISLCINLTNCPCNCKSCHSPELSKDIGTVLDAGVIDLLIKGNKGITCVCLLGGDNDPYTVRNILRYIKVFYPELKTAWYSGRDKVPDPLFYAVIDYLKLGPYIEELGPLSSKTTNQRMYEVYLKEDGEGEDVWELVDITSKFWKDDKSQN